MQMVHHGDSLPGLHSVWGLRWEDARAGSGLTAGGWNRLEVFFSHMSGGQCWLSAEVSAGAADLSNYL